MKSVLFMRHAKSSWKDQTLDDHDRPLNRRGKSQAPEIGRLIRAHGLMPDMIVSSTAKRARRTAELVMEGSGYRGDLLALRSLFECGPAAYIAALAQLRETIARVLLIGHNPGLSELVEQIGGAPIELTTGMLVEVHVDLETWKAIDANTRGSVMTTLRPEGGADEAN